MGSVPPASAEWGPWVLGRAGKAESRYKKTAVPVKTQTNLLFNSSFSTPPRDRRGARHVVGERLVLLALRPRALAARPSVGHTALPPPRLAGRRERRRPREPYPALAVRLSHPVVYAVLREVPRERSVGAAASLELEPELLLDAERSHSTGARGRTAARRTAR